MFEISQERALHVKVKPSHHQGAALAIFINYPPWCSESTPNYLQPVNAKHDFPMCYLLEDCQTLVDMLEVVKLVIICSQFLRLLGQPNHTVPILESYDKENEPIELFKKKHNEPIEQAPFLFYFFQQIIQSSLAMTNRSTSLMNDNNHIIDNTSLFTIMCSRGS